jgi:hypothetical protein
MRSKLANRSREDATATENSHTTYIAPSLTRAPIAPPALDRIDVVTP